MAKWEGAPGPELLELLDAAEAVYFDAQPLSYTRQRLAPVLIRAGRVCDCCHRPHSGLCSECGHLTWIGKAAARAAEGGS